MSLNLRSPSLTPAPYPYIHRYATLPNIMKAKKKPITAFTPQDLGVEVQQQLVTVKVTTAGLPGCT